MLDCHSGGYSEISGNGIIPTMSLKRTAVIAG